jgi:hypothetical protein
MNRLGVRTRRGLHEQYGDQDYADKVDSCDDEHEFLSMIHLTAAPAPKRKAEPHCEERPDTL